jgi:S-adenosylmethionine:tRNA ribosyltransferase-isomerase
LIAAGAPVQRPLDAKLLVVGASGDIAERPRSAFAELLQRGDVVIANDAATLPASLFGRHAPSGAAIEVRLAGRASLQDVTQFSAIVFGAGDFRMRTEDRPKPPRLNTGDLLELGPLVATVARVDRPRHIALNFEGSPREIWEGLARHGRPIQYAHVAAPLALWDSWTTIAGPPVAFEPPSAGFALDWRMLAAIMARGARFGAITHAAGISSTGDAELDALLPFDEFYRVPQATAALIADAQMHRRRVIAIGTSVVRALEHAAGTHGGIVAAGEGLATQRIGPASCLRIVDAMLSGVHEPGSSHYELLRAFVSDERLRLVDRELNARDFRIHEFGDSVFIEKAGDKMSVRPAARTPSPLVGEGWGGGSH